MYFVVIKSSFDGICGGGSRYDDISQVLAEVSFHRGWDSKAEMHAAIRKWAKSAVPGSVFCTQASAIVAVSPGSSLRADDECPECLRSGLEYGEIDGTNETLRQESWCPECRARWQERFGLIERIRLASKD